MGSETGPLDDAALVRPEGARDSLVLTLDVITPVVDDPLAFGRIAAANALSDVYAMGGVPEVALSFIGMPDSLGLDVLEAVLRGAAEKASEAGCAIVGGHSIRDTEPKCGLAVVGRVEPDRAWTHRGARPGQAIVLTKPLGTGVIAQALRAGGADPEWVATATRSMEALNLRARDAGREHGVTAATDVTGFGLLAHLHHVVSASGVSAIVRASDVPLLPGALEATQRGFVPGGSRRNQRYVGAHLVGADAVDPTLLTILCDAQTSGGLVLTLPAEEAATVVTQLGGAGAAAVVGEIVAGEAGSVRLV